MLLLWTVYLYTQSYTYTGTEALNTSAVRESHPLRQIHLQLLDEDVRVQVRLPIARHVQAATS